MCRFAITLKNSASRSGQRNILEIEGRLGSNAKHAVITEVSRNALLKGVQCSNRKTDGRGRAASTPPDGSGHDFAAGIGELDLAMLINQAALP